MASETKPAAGPVAKPIEGPDFICIGMPRSGTGWLFDQVQFHPEFWMPPTKEFDYLKPGPALKLKNVVNRLERAQARTKANERRGFIKWGNRRAGDERDIKFLEEASAGVGKPMEIANYRVLFRFKGDLKSGDVSPSYVTLTEDIIKNIARELPDTKIMLMVRDPVARASSQISMAYRLDKFDESIIHDPDEFRSYLQTARTTNQRAFPTQIVARWKEHAPKINFRWFLFDDIEQTPDDARRNILTHLGADPAKGGEQMTPEHNRKADTKKLTLTDEAKKVLVEHFADEIVACGELFNGPARNWRTRYGL
jgi:hypothetical protein